MSAAKNGLNIDVEAFLYRQGAFVNGIVEHFTGFIFRNDTAVDVRTVVVRDHEFDTAKITDGKATLADLEDLENLAENVRQFNEEMDYKNLLAEIEKVDIFDDVKSVLFIEGMADGMIINIDDDVYTAMALPSWSANML